MNLDYENVAPNTIDSSENPGRPPNAISGKGF
jgi:hypothetical protein